MAIPLIIAAASGGALVWETVHDFLFGNEPTTVINAQPGATVNAGGDKGGSLFGVSTNTLALLAAGAAVAWWWQGRR